MKWISIHERLPTNSKPILIWDEKNSTKVAIGSYTAERKFEYWSGSWCNLVKINGPDNQRGITHWAYIEEPESKSTNITEIEQISALIQLEFVDASQNFGKFNSTHEGYAVIKEELDEMWDEIKANNSEKACDEAIQVGAMALRFIFDCMPEDEWLRNKINEQQ